ncbi:hypothetical protein ILUMI_08345 [Ignelater luminosus]|uniref:Reverse transcriptase domain-containing protein n=1 Tax=Ignelater luminosus TaxID=2038154 RepID=A0A8K0D6F7_IGNLU|nr:hypothetical protein ILUMI_08345 [Ignelater luminosus]
MWLLRRQPRDKACPISKETNYDELYNNNGEYYAEAKQIEKIADTEQDIEEVNINIISEYVTKKEAFVHDEKSTLEQELALPLHHIYDIENIDNKVQYFNDSLLNLVNIHFPLKQSIFSKNPQPWITPNIKLMMKLRSNALKRYKRTRDLTHFQYYKTLRNFTTASIHREKKAFLEFSFHVKDAKLLWKNLKQFDIVTNNKSKNILPVLRDVNKINNYFVNSLPAFYLADNDVLQFYDNNLMRNYENRLCFSSVAGADVLNITLLKMCCPHILPYITHIINVFLETSTFPTAWKKAVIVPLPKISEPTSYKDLRPISLLPTLSKVIEKIINKQIREHLTKYTILPEIQSGFRPD